LFANFGGDRISIKMAVSSIISVQEMEFLIEQNFTYGQISMQLQSENPKLKGLSPMSIRRFCKQHNIGRNCKLNSDERKTEITKCALEV